MMPIAPGDPSCQMQRRRKGRRARRADRSHAERGADRGRGRDSARQKTRGEPCGQSVAVALQCEKHSAAGCGKHQHRPRGLWSASPRKEVRGTRALKIASAETQRRRSAPASRWSHRRSVEAKARGCETPCRIAARAPSTIPPSWENGSTSAAASRTIRAQTNTPQVRRRRVGQQNVPGGSEEQERAPDATGKGSQTRPIPPTGRREHGAASRHT